MLASIGIYAGVVFALLLAILALHCLPCRPVTGTALTAAGAESPAFPLTALHIVYGFLAGLWALHRLYGARYCG